jgi:hypothetical protein
LRRVSYARSFNPLLRRASLLRICFHVLRHIRAALLLLRNVNPRPFRRYLVTPFFETSDTHSYLLNGQETIVNALGEALVAEVTATAAYNPA